MVGADVVDAVAEGYRINLPERVVGGAAADDIPALIALDRPGVIIEAVKLAQDGSGDVIMRLYEALGESVRTRLTAGFEMTGVRGAEPAALPTGDAAREALILSRRWRR